MLQRKTLLEIVQSTLSSMDSDLVNHIGDTQESEQIALLAQEQYLELATYQRIPQFEQLTQLEGLSDLDRATVMRIPEGATDIADVRYRRVRNDGTEYMEPVEQLDKSDFLDMQLRLNQNNLQNNILDDNILVPYRTDRAPRCYTTFDDEYIVFDSIDKDVDDTLHNDASMVLAYIVPEFLMEDDFIPQIPTKMLSQYMNMIKEIANHEQKQYNNPFRTRDAERQGNRNRHFGGILDGLDQGQGSTRERESQGRRVYGRYRYGRNRTSRIRTGYSS